jgi:hypothetical protein
VGRGAWGAQAERINAIAIWEKRKGRKNFIDAISGRMENKKTCQPGQERDYKLAILPVHSSYLRGCGERFMGGDLAYQVKPDLQLRNSTGLTLRCHRFRV